MVNSFRIIMVLLGILIWSQCKNSENKVISPSADLPLFVLTDSQATGVNFINRLHFDEDFNIYTYRNFYNGGGVAIGDINNDGWRDIFFTSNMESNKLFLNKGDWTFEDITTSAGVGGTRSWSTGVSIADVNGDGLADIYVCNSGDVKGDNKQNELFINQGDLTFKEQAAEYGLDDRGFSTHAAFFDYDHDGDLDMYLLNNSYRSIGSFNLKYNERLIRDSLGGDKLYRNDGHVFHDVSEEAGIYGSIIGFGLGVTVGDVDNDGWQDIYVSNDFFERDYLYLNQHNSTFKEVLTEQMPSISAASMGAAMGDIDNDLYQDVFVTEMLPHDNRRLKTKTTFEDWDTYQYKLENGYYHQFTRNVLQHNNGNGFFSEIGRMAGVEATDWSWGALIADFDLDGWKDLFVANGIYQDLTDQDYLNFIANDSIKSLVTQTGKSDFEKLVSYIPTESLRNYFYKNNTDWTFSDVSEKSGINKESFSNGSAYGDLDNDGDMDLVINNVNMPAFVYKNQSKQLPESPNHLVFEITGNSTVHPIGTKVICYAHADQQMLELMPNTGFQSTMDNRLFFGFGTDTLVDSVKVIFNNQMVKQFTHIRVNQTIQVKVEDATHSDINNNTPLKTKWASKDEANSKLFAHRENDFCDFDRDRMLYHMKSTEGPALASGDVNGDGLIDFYVGGAKDQAGALYVQTRTGAFKIMDNPAFMHDKESEDVDAEFFDADGDQDIDLYVASGGNEFSNISMALSDRLYLNNGGGVMTKSPQNLPTFKNESTACVTSGDADGDGDIDLFVGIRLEPKFYGIPMNGYLLINDGAGQFSDKTQALAPELNKLGLITDAQWVDIDLDKDLDLVVVGEWMPITLFIQDQGRWTNKSKEWGLSEKGYFQALHVADLNDDDYPDLVVGNLGLNSRFRASVTEPIGMVINDFDQNGTVEQIYTMLENGKEFPFILKHDLVAQVPSLKKQILRYDQFATRTVQELFGSEQFAKSIRLEINQLAHVAAINEKGTRFVSTVLPKPAQISPVYSIITHDFNLDGVVDLLLGGNLYQVKPELGRYDASQGVLLAGRGDGTFRYENNRAIGLNVQGQVRNMAILPSSAGGHKLIIAKNNDYLETYALKN